MRCLAELAIRPMKRPLLSRLPPWSVIWKAIGRNYRRLAVIAFTAVVVLTVVELLAVALIPKHWNALVAAIGSPDRSKPHPNNECIFPTGLEFAAGSTVKISASGTYWDKDCAGLQAARTIAMVGDDKVLQAVYLRVAMMNSEFFNRAMEDVAGVFQTAFREREAQQFTGDRCNWIYVSDPPIYSIQLSCLEPE